MFDGDLFGRTCANLKGRCPSFIQFITKVLKVTITIQACNRLVQSSPINYGMN